ncbi:MAG: type II secretion system F family protein [Coprococcus sp.]
MEEQRYTLTGDTEKFSNRVMEEMDEVILGENKSLDRVEKDLNLLTEWKDYPVQIQWELDHYEVMNVQGEIQTEKTKAEGTLVELTGRLMYGGEEALYVTNAMVYPESKSKEEKLLSDVLQLVEEKEKTTKTEKVFLLPSEKINETTNSLGKKKVESRGYYVLGLGMVSAVLMIALKKQNEQKARKARKEQMLTDYPEIINKFALLLSTGMTTKNVWERIVKNYEEQKICTGERAAYEEMRYTCNEMQSGITEAEAYERFGKRCGISVYMKFGALLAQNLKKGTKGMTDLLRNESDQAFENRKSRAKRLGEEAGTKLLAPMFGMLAIVLVIVIVPAFLSMQL